MLHDLYDDPEALLRTLLEGGPALSEDYKQAGMEPFSNAVCTFCRADIAIGASRGVSLVRPKGGVLSAAACPECFHALGTCDVCTAWREVSKGDGVGHCRKGPPDAKRDVNGWRLTSEDAWCGAFSQARPMTFEEVRERLGMGEKEKGD